MERKQEETLYYLVKITQTNINRHDRSFNPLNIKTGMSKNLDHWTAYNVTTIAVICRPVCREVEGNYTYLYVAQLYRLYLIELQTSSTFHFTHF